MFGSRVAAQAKTPEQYFDFCGRQIRGMRAVIVAAGLGRETPPVSITRTMGGTGGGGDALLARYLER